MTFIYKFDNIYLEEERKFTRRFLLTSFIKNVCGGTNSFTFFFFLIKILTNIDSFAIFSLRRIRRMVMNKKNTPIDQDYFDKELLFLNVDDFFLNRQIVKETLDTKDIDTIYYYRAYVYSKPFVADMWKDYIWDYLMGDLNDLDFVYIYSVHKKRPIN